MPIVAVFEGPALTQKVYEQSVRKVTGGKSLETPGDWPVEGLLVHAAGQGKNSFRVVDVWESEAAFQRFGETIVPILKELGVDIEPDVYPTHTFVSA